MILFSVLSAFLLGPIAVTGKVSDSQEEPLPYCNVVCVSDSSLLAYAVTQEDGSFVIDIQENTSVNISFIGYEPFLLTYHELVSSYQVNKGASGHSVNLGNICLKEQVQALQELEIIEKTVS